MAVKDKLIQVLIPVAAYALSIAVPVVPSEVWSALITGVMNGNILLEDIQGFIKDHNIKVYSDPDADPKLYPTQRNSGL